MSENNKPLDSEKKSHGGNTDAELEQLLLQVFGSKDNLEKERKLAAEKRSGPPDLSFSNPNENNSPQNKEGRPKKENRPPDREQNKRPPDSQNRQKKRPPSAQGRPAEGGANQPGGAGNSGQPPRKKRPAPNGQRPVPNGQRTAPANRQRTVNKGHGQKQNPKPGTNQKKPITKKQSKLEKKISKLSGRKKAAVIIGVIVGILLVFALLIYGLYSFYYSLFGRYNGKLNEGRYQYDSSDYVEGPDTMTEEELKKQLEGTATDPMKDKDVMNVLLIGEDLRDTESQERGNTDVMMMISLNKKLKTVTMTSFLRDTWVDISGYGTDKLNAAYWRDGPELLKDTIEKYYGVSIDRYVIVNFESFIKIVDTLGGITLDVTDEEAEGMKKPMAEQNNILGNKKGTDYLESGGTGLTLNGNQALAYARLRYVGNADYERTERQRRVINEIINESKSLSLLEINSLVQEIFPQVKLDITKSEMASLLLNCLDYMNYEIQQLQMPSANLFTEERINNLSVLCPDFQANSELLIKTIYGEDAISTDESQSGTDDSYSDNYYDDYNDYNDYNNYY